MPIYKRLSVWRKAHALTLRVFDVTAPLAARSQVAMASQMRRAAVSIAANIAEGSGRTTSAHFALHLQHAIASARELDYHLLLARDLALITPTDHATLEARTDEVCKMLVSLRKTVVSRPARAGSSPKPRRKQEDEK